MTHCNVSFKCSPFGGVFFFFLILIYFYILLTSCFLTFCMVKPSRLSLDAFNVVSSHYHICKWKNCEMHLNPCILFDCLALLIAVFEHQNHETCPIGA